MARILAVDDEPGILDVISDALARDGHTVKTAASADAVPVDSLGDYDLILLDVMMPGTDGMEFCRQIRGIVDCPIIMLTAKSMEDDALDGFAMGADDYLRKPFGTRELAARVDAHLRRERREHHSVLVASGIRFDLAACAATVDETAVPLTKSEYAICEYLARHRGQVFSRSRIQEAVFGFDNASDPAAIVEHVKNIRGKFAAFAIDPIETVWGIGYRWV